MQEGYRQFSRCPKSFPHRWPARQCYSCSSRQSSDAHDSWDGIEFEQVTVWSEDFQTYIGGWCWQQGMFLDQYRDKLPAWQIREDLTATLREANLEELIDFQAPPGAAAQSAIYEWHRARERKRQEAEEAEERAGGFFDQTASGFAHK